jgi:hypothetical protein
MGTMRSTKAEATTPIGTLKRPRFQGPGRKREPTKKTRIKIGVINAVYVRVSFCPYYPSPPYPS